MIGTAAKFFNIVVPKALPLSPFSVNLCVPRALSSRPKIESTIRAIQICNGSYDRRN